MMTNRIPISSLFCVALSLLVSACAVAGGRDGTVAVAQVDRPVHSVRGVDHVGLTVTDLNATTQFFVEVLGFDHFRSDDSYPSHFLRNGHVIVTLWRVADPDDVVSFDRKRNVGLHHLALSVDSFEALERLHERVSSFPGVRIEFAPELLGGGPAKHMMFREPSGNRMELIHRP